MKRADKYDRLSVGLIAGFLLPVITALLVYLFTHGEQSLTQYFKRIADADIITHTLSLSVLPNLIIFLIFNRLDMLRAARGVLGITLFWAVMVFGIKFLR